MSNVNNVVAGKPDKVSGGILVGALDALAPTDATVELDAAFAPAGYIHEDGLTENTERSTEKVKAWGGDVVKITQTEHSVTYGFQFIEILSETVLKTVYGDDNVTVTPATVSTGKLTTVEVTGDEVPARSYVFEVKDGDAKIRLYVPNGHVTEEGETTYKDDEVAAYPVTIEALPDANGVKVYKFMDDGKLAAA